MSSPLTVHVNKAASAPPRMQALTSSVSASETVKLSTAVDPSATDGVRSPAEYVGVKSFASSTVTVYEIVAPVLTPSLMVTVTE